MLFVLTDDLLLDTPRLWLRLCTEALREVASLEASRVLLRCRRAFPSSDTGSCISGRPRIRHSISGRVQDAKITKEMMKKVIPATRDVSRRNLVRIPLSRYQVCIHD